MLDGLNVQYGFDCRILAKERDPSAVISGKRIPAPLSTIAYLRKNGPIVCTSFMTRRLRKSLNNSRKPTSPIAILDAKGI